MSILELLRRPGEGVEMLEAKLKEISGRLPGLRQAVAELEARRSSALLTEDDRAVERIEVEVAKARRDHDRAVVAQAEIERRIAAMRAEAEKVRLDRLRADAERRAREAAEGFRKAYATHAARIVEVCEELEKADAEVQRANDVLARSGRVGDVVLTARERVSFVSATGWRLDPLALTSLCRWPGVHSGIGEGRRLSASWAGAQLQDDN
jgi:chromosome segregation ATPase